MPIWQALKCFNELQFRCFDCEGRRKPFSKNMSDVNVFKPFDVIDNLTHILVILDAEVPDVFRVTIVNMSDDKTLRTLFNAIEC